ncbi:HalOD1 output domain-containing protein [Halorussus sp. AFM4]|uniref:HalOD1 output domain-containing protein n=1 Tax=Halorussus sp. AFM4 TaxID=3421651 RepID=UPI003EB74CB6
MSRTVVETVAALEDVAETELPILADSVDPGALDRLFGPRFDGDRRAVEGRVEFEYAGYRVAVASDGEFTVSPIANDG